MAEEHDDYPLGYFDKEDWDDGPGCRAPTEHHNAVGFCSHHQLGYCRLCSPVCPECIHDPHCGECGVSLNEEEHDWDCSYAAGDDDDD